MAENPGQIQHRGTDPRPAAVLDAMEPGVPYTTSDIAALFDDVTRWTIDRRLHTLQDRGDVEKKKHAKNRVTWWIPVVEEAE